jgi:hypothetical protein
MGDSSGSTILNHVMIAAKETEVAVRSDLD